MKKRLPGLTAALILAVLLLTACGDADTPESQTPPPPEEEEISFPYAVPESPLVIENPVRYDGLYLEDGSDIEMAGVAALLVRNTGETCVDYAKLTLTGSKTTQEFVISGLEAGASLLVQEAGKAPAVSQDYDIITADVALTDHFERSEDLLKITETEDGALKITNLTEESLPCVRVFYKFYHAQEKVFLGGITYTAKLEDLGAGASETMRPSHYVSGQSRVIMAKVYEEGTE